MSKEGQSTFLLPHHPGARRLPEPSLPSLPVVPLTGFLPWLSPVSSWTHAHLQSPQYPVAGALKPDYLLHEKSLHLFFGMPPVSFIWYRVFRVLQEAADNLLLSMQLTFSDLSLPCLSSCFFRPRSPGSAINESHHLVLLPFSALLWTFPVLLHVLQGGELELQPISNVQENHWHNDEPFLSLMRQILKYSSSLVNKSLSQL